ncbi:MAG: hypothetical protein MJ244_06730, partial [Clostridia bacterium]|nr:hypothetical protein [Clostridia bacterium]
MKKITKRIMALMLSLVMMLGCIPSFINEADATEKDYYELILSNIKFNVDSGDMGLTFEEKVATYCGVEVGGYHFQIEYPIEGVDCLDAYLESIYDDYPQETPQEPNFVSEDIGGDTLYYRLKIGAYGNGKFDGTKTLKVKAPGCTIELPTVTRRDSSPSPSYYADGTGYYLDNDQLVACIDFRLTNKVTNLDLTYSSFYGKYDGLRFNESNNSLTATGFDLKTTDENIGLKDEDMLIIYSNSDGSGSSVYSFTDGVTYYVRTSLYISEGDIRTFSNEFNKYYLMINGNKVNLSELHPKLFAYKGKDNANLVFYAPLTAKKLACFDFKGDFDLITHDTNIEDRNQLLVTFVDEKTNTKFNFTPYVKWYKTYNNPTDSYTDEVTTGKFEEDYYYVMGSIDLKSYMGFGDPQAIINDAKTNGFNILWPSIDIDSTYEDEHNYIRKYINPRIDIDTKNSTFTFRGQIDICPMPRVTDFEIESFDEDSLTIKLTGTNLFSYANHFGRFEMQFNSENFGCNLTNGGNLTVNGTNTEATIVYPRDEFAPKFKSGDEMNIIIGGGASSQNRFEFAKSFTLGNATPKISITSVSLNGRGNLIGGVAISKQTLRYTEADGLKYKSNDDRGKTWYTTSACDVQADAIVAGTEYYKKITLDPVDGYKFDTITNVPVTNGTFVSATTNGKKLDVVIKATAEEFLQRDITVDVYKNNVKSNDPFIAGSTNSNISFKDGVKTVYADWYENKAKNTGTITFDKTKLQTAIITINDEYKEPTSVKVGGTTLTKVTDESGFYTDELSSVYYYDSTNYKVVIKHLTMPKKSTLIINPTKDLYVGQDV